MAVNNTNSNDNKKRDAREDPRMAALQQKRAQAVARAGSGLSVESAGQFLKDTQAELKKTTWPDRPTLTKSTLIVLAFIIAAAVWEFVIGSALDKITAPLFGR